MSNTGPGIIQSVGPFRGSPQEFELKNRTPPPAKESALNPLVSADEVELTLDAQRQATAAHAAAGHRLIGLDPEAQLLAQQAQAMVTEEQDAMRDEFQKISDDRKMIAYQQSKRVALTIGDRIAREAERKRGKFQTEAHRGLVEGENVAKGGAASSAGDSGGSGESGNG